MSQPPAGKCRRTEDGGRRTGEERETGTEQKRATKSFPNAYKVVVASSACFSRLSSSLVILFIIFRQQLFFACCFGLDKVGDGGGGGRSSLLIFSTGQEFIRGQFIDLIN
jgi:hypothetical protein